MLLNPDASKQAEEVVFPTKIITTEFTILNFLVSGKESQTFT